MEPVTKTLQFVVLSRDRPVLLAQTLNSVLADLPPHVDVLVSDNSDTEDVQHLLNRDFPSVKCIRRQPVLPALTHFQVVIESCPADYLVIFHDDDRVRPGYLRRLMGVLDSKPELAGVACDAFVLQGDQLTTNHYSKLSKPSVIQAPGQLLTRYFAMDARRPAPFPSYMYRTSLLRGLCLRFEEGGKYADVAFLAALLGRGPLLWLPEPLIDYRIHANNDSAGESVGQRLRLLRHLWVQGYLERKSRAHLDYRFRYWLSWLRQVHKSKKSTRRMAVVHHFLLRQFFTNLMFRPAFWQRVFGKLR